jgi:hypothetical protein
MFRQVEVKALQNKRAQYKQSRDSLWTLVDTENLPVPTDDKNGSKVDPSDILLDDNYLPMKDQIIRDVNRTQADTTLFKSQKIKNLMTRLLLVWHVRFGFLISEKT